MENFNVYAQYYNLLYKNKNYKKEVEYINKLIETYSDKKIAKVLDIGCGTGLHDELLAEQYKVVGVDSSVSMIEFAQEKSSENLSFKVCDARSFDLKEKFDAVVSLFHVASYQNTNSDVENYFQTANKHLEKGGVFIFDFWYGPAVLTDPPVVRVKRLEDENVKICRIAEPCIHPNKNIVDVNYEIITEQKNSSEVSKINETHSMRYFFMPELEMGLNKCGFELISYKEWLNFEKTPDLNSWNVVVVAKKK